jgi:hypothetical protein
MSINVMFLLASFSDVLAVAPELVNRRFEASSVASAVTVCRANDVRITAIDVVLPLLS